MTPRRRSNASKKECTVHQEKCQQTFEKQCRLCYDDVPKQSCHSVPRREYRNVADTVTDTIYKTVLEQQCRTLTDVECQTLLVTHTRKGAEHQCAAVPHEQCHTIWENKFGRQCRTTHEQRCRVDYETTYFTVHEQQCHDEYEDRCFEVSEQDCKSVQETACSDESSGSSGGFNTGSFQEGVSSSSSDIANSYRLLLFAGSSPGVLRGSKGVLRLSI